MSRRPHHGVSSQSAATNSASRTVRNDRAEVRLNGGDHRVHGEQAHQAEEHVRAQPDLGIQGQQEHNRQRQGSLRDPLPDLGREVQDRDPGDVSHGVEKQQPPRGIDPAPDRAVPRLRRVQRYCARTAAEHADGRHHRLTGPGAARSARPSLGRHRQDRPLRPSPCHLALLATCSPPQRAPTMRAPKSGDDTANAFPGRSGVVLLISRRPPPLGHGHVSGSCGRRSYASRVR